MKIITTCFLCIICTTYLQAERLVPSSLDPTYAEAREKAFIPWSSPEEASAFWKKLSSTNVPIYCERKSHKLSRDIYIPNPGTGYWVLGGLSEKSLFETHKKKLKIGDTLISASFYEDGKGDRIYWALWAPQKRAHLLTEPMAKLGITQAKIEFTLSDHIKAWSASLVPYSDIIGALTLITNMLILIVVLLMACTRKCQKVQLIKSDPHTETPPDA